MTHASDCAADNSPRPSVFDWHVVTSPQPLSQAAMTSHTTPQAARASAAAQKDAHTRACRQQGLLAAGQASATATAMTCQRAPQPSLPTSDAHAQEQHAHTVFTSTLPCCPCLFQLRHTSRLTFCRQRLRDTGVAHLVDTHTACKLETGAHQNLFLKKPPHPHTAMRPELHKGL